jgi:PAS domain S-box-containing protein
MPTSVPPTDTGLPAYQIARHILRLKFLRNILIVCLAVALLLPLYNWIFVTPAFRRLNDASSEDNARRVANHLVHLLELDRRPISTAMDIAALDAAARGLKADFNLEKLRLFDSRGRIVFSTDAAEIGQHNSRPYFVQKVAEGHLYSQVVARGMPTREGRVEMRDVVEVYVPVMRQETFLGAFEIYYDITAARHQLDRLLRNSNITLGLAALLMMTVVAAALFKAGQAMLAHSRTDRALQDAHATLERRIRERTEDLINANKDLQMEIMERRMAEANLGQTEMRFRTLIETIPHGIQEIDTDGVIIFANPAHADIYGYTPDELVGKSIFDLAADTDAAQRLNAHLAYLMDEQPHPSPWFGKDRTKEGRTIDTQVDWNYKRDARGRVSGLTMVISDITHRKRAEKALLDNLAFMNTLIDTIPNPVFYKDSEGVFMGCNIAYARTLGLSKDEILGHRLIDLDSSIADDMAVHFHHQDIFLIANPGIQTHESQVLCADNAERDFVLYKATFNDTEGQVAGMVGIMLDISDLKKAERRRRQLELQLQQTQKMEALGTLAGGIAHDFNNILAAIIGYTEIVVADTPLETVSHDYLKRVLEAGERARSLVKQILAFSRQGEMEPKPVQLKLIIKEVLKLLRASLPATIEIDQQIDSDGAVMADPSQLHQVMMNLGTNAGYAMGQTGGRLTVRLEEVLLDEDFIRLHAGLSPGKFLRLTVGDTGHGIDARNLSRIFDPFFTTKPKGEGTGMGLSVVHGIVTGLRGTITVDSATGKGARFQVYLPALQDGAAVSAAPAGTLPTGEERILFVDDEPFQTDMLKHLLGLLGYRVEARNSAAAALELFQQDPRAFDLVITDMVMPGLTGDELAARLLDIRPDLPVILITGYSQNITEARAKSMGIKAFALKPLVIDELSRLIRQVLDDSLRSSPDKM